MRVHKQKNLPQTGWMDFYPPEDLTPEQIEKLWGYERVVFSFDDKSNLTALEFFKGAIHIILRDFDVYLVFAETMPQVKTAVRTHKKLFYDSRSQIAQEDRFETEIDAGDGQSILAGAIKLNHDNWDYCTANLVNSTLQFAYIIYRDQPGPDEDWATFFQHLWENMFGGRVLYTNYPKILADFTDKTQSVARLASYVKDETVEFLSMDRSLLKFLDLIEKYFEDQLKN